MEYISRHMKKEFWECAGLTLPYSQVVYKILKKEEYFCKIC